MKSIYVLMSMFSVGMLATAQEVSVARFQGDRQCAVSLPFDDGVQEDYTLIAPHLDRYALKATFAINASVLGDLDDHYSPRMTWEECRSLVRSGHELSNHSWSHPHLTELDDDSLHMEIARNDSAIEKETGKRPVTFIYPYNAVDDRVRAATLEGRICNREYQFGLGQANSHQTRESVGQWLREQIDKGAWGVTMSHGIYTAWDRWEEPWILWDLFRELAYKSDTIWTETFAKVGAYVAERDAVRLDVVMKKGIITVTSSLNLDPVLFSEKLTLKVSGMPKPGTKAAKKIFGYRAVQDDKNLPLIMKGDDLLCDFNPYGGPITIEPIKTDPLAGKTINIIGDSYVQNHLQSFENAWHYKVAAKHGMTYNNYGRNGGAIAFDRTNRNFGKALYVRYADMVDDADYVLVVAGHNDAYFVTQSKDSLEAFLKHLDEFYTGLRNKYPNAKIAVVSPWNLSYEGFPVVIRAIQEACERHGFPFLNAATTSGIEVENEEFRRQYFQHPRDRAHLNPQGHDLLVPWGEQFLISL
ncbi:MAG: polysaccharide deacetylase family protein [Bacteroidales bacterium]|nr:polysaccharide deacetylase family protein [Bacteroidales bacterium]